MALNRDFTSMNYDFYTYCSNGKLKRKNYVEEERGDYYGCKDRITLWLKFSHLEEYGALYFRNSRNESWIDTKFEIPKHKPIKIAVSIWSGNNGQSSVEWESFHSSL